MSRDLYLVTYDIADDRRRTRVFQIMMSHGDHTQFSVFLCELDPMEAIRLKQKLLDEIHNLEDQILFVHLGAADRPRRQIIDCIGRRYIPPVRVKIV